MWSPSTFVCMCCFLHMSSLIEAQHFRTVETISNMRREVLGAEQARGGWLRLEDIRPGGAWQHAGIHTHTQAKHVAGINDDLGIGTALPDFLTIISDALHRERARERNTSNPYVGSERLHRRESMRYLEIGVSVGKNVFATLQLFHRSWNVVGLTFEQINPLLEEKVIRLQHDSAPLHMKSQANSQQPVLLDEWKRVDRAPFMERYGTGSCGDVVKASEYPDFLPYTASRYSVLHTAHGPKDFTYVHADEFDKTAWAVLGKHGPFDLILSDACHTSNAVKYECDSIVEFRLIDFSKAFAVVWDDDMLNNHCLSTLEVAARQRLSKANVTLSGRAGPHTVNVVGNLADAHWYRILQQLRQTQVSYSAALPNVEVRRHTPA